jgi:3-hydroxyacyl-CoA dehydrogenase/alkylation response protein AidB-like acyl-CoA dehydrogenase/enoyl-CoA hydratase/carnithine racemase
MIAASEKREIPFAKITRFEHRRRSELHPEQPEIMDESAPVSTRQIQPGEAKGLHPGELSPAPASGNGEKSQRTVRRTVREDGICILTLDRPESSANIFDERALIELGEELNWVASAPNLKGLVLISAKRSIFVAGADLKSMSEKAPAEIKTLVELGQDVMNRLAGLRIPTVAAIHGAAVGGGYELCLACDYRIASDDKSTKIGLPETQIGLLPAWGGATRLPRLVGLPKALDVILAGKTMPAKKAFIIGMVDQVVPSEYLLPVAIKALARGKSKQKGHALFNNAAVAGIIRARARGQVLSKTRGHYPAVIKALEVVTSGISKSLSDSLALERKAILELVETDACRNLIGLFFLQERAKKRTVPIAPESQKVGDVSPSPRGEGRGEGPARQKTLPSHAAVIGAGVMGAGIAQWLAARGLNVILRDINTERVAAGMGTIAKLFQDGAKRRVFSPREAREGMDRISPAPAEVPLKRVDFIIEAAVEKLDLKKQIFQRLDALVGPDTILATNTSALPISELAASTRQPERVVGLHFFNPVHRMQLVEIVAARQTSPEVLQRSLQFVQQLGKLPVVVKDSPGFLVNRILMPYLIEAGSLFEAGASVRSLDEAMLDFGMPMGPMRLLDEVGIDVSLHVAHTLAAAFKDRLVLPEVLSKMAAAGLLGRKTGRGFYSHRKGKEPQANAEIASFVKTASSAEIPQSELAQRMVLLMVNEAARCLEEGIVTDPADVDFAMVMGTGFAPFRGGPLRYADTVGLAKIVERMQRLVTAGDKHFEPCALLRQLATENKTFYAKAKTSSPPTSPTIPAGQTAETVAPTPVSTPNKPMPAPSPIAEPPPVKPAAEEPKSLIDTSKMSSGQRAALELTEAARETTKEPTLASGIFMGSLKLANVYSPQTIEDRDQGDAFLKSLDKILREKTDPDEIDRTGEIPEPVIDELAKLGAFGIKISREYGGLGLSQTNYCRAAMLLGGWCGNLTALLSAHQSIGVPQPLILFGTEEQKRKYLPRVAAGEISAFALTESGVGSDPATMQTRAEPTSDGKDFILNGEKLWCTNGTKAGVLVVMAKTPPKMVNGKAKEQVTAFIVETNWPGVHVTHRCRFMGLKALYNAVVRFENVKIPRENILLAEGKGLRVALTTLNTGRLTLPAACAGLSKRCLEVTRKWASQRVQWGAPIGKHAAIADKVAKMAANTFAMEAMTLLAASKVDADKHADVRLEAAMCKMWGSEQSWEIVNDALQIRGGRGYETADSLKARGDEPVPLERFLRDCRINTIFEGSSEIMRLFIAREALDPHLKVSAAVLNSQLPMSQRLRAALKAGLFYARWYPKQWLPWSPRLRTGPLRVPGQLASHLRYAARASRRLARSLFHAMLRHGPKLEKQQVLLGRFVEIGAEIFAITATCLRAAYLKQTEPDGQSVQLANFFCQASRFRIEDKFRALHHNADSDGYRLAQQLLGLKSSSRNGNGKPAANGQT